MNQCLLILDYNVLFFVLKLAVINVGCQLGNFILECISVSSFLKFSMMSSFWFIIRSDTNVSFGEELDCLTVWA